MKWLTTYKKEVERTEQLGIEYQTALDNIITEIKKDDNISLDRILDIVDCIQYIKRVRKRWASGSNSNAKNVRNLNLPFAPSIVIAHIESTDYIDGRYGGDGEGGGVIIVTKNLKIEMLGWFTGRGGYTYDHTRLPINVVDGNFDVSNYKLDQRRNRTDLNHKVKKWWAFD